MTTITFHTEGSRITGFDAVGHSGYAEAGEDIVCAAGPSAGRLIACPCHAVMGRGAAVTAREADASISLRLPGSLGPSAESACQALLTGMMVYLSQLHCEYPDFIEVMEAE